MKTFRKLAGVLTAAAVAAVSSVCVFAAPSPDAEAVLKFTQTNAITGAEVSGVDKTTAPDGAVSVVVELNDCAAENIAILDAAKPADASVVAYAEVDVDWVDASGNKVADYEGPCTVTLKYASMAGDLVLHEKADGTVETLTPSTINTGVSADVEFTSLSPIAIIRPVTNTNGNGSNGSSGSSSSQVLGAGVNMTTYIIIIAGLAACAAVLGSVVILRKKH